MAHSKLSIAGIFLLSSVLACSGGEAATLRGARGAVKDSSAGTVALGLGTPVAYRPAAAATGTGASLAGTITLKPRSAPPKPDSLIAVNRDQKTCGDSVRLTDIPANGSTLGNTLVWIDGVTSGKPLPELRRDRLVIQNCQFEPRVMAVPIGTTINIFSADGIEHDARFYREAAGDPIDEVRTFNYGSVVPSEKIAKAPGIVEVRSRLRPYARGYVAVFNHPYYAVTDANGVFKIEGLPGGTYTVKVWHEGLTKPTEQRVTIAPNGSGRLDVALPLE
jgi:hypothetical protein